MDSDASSGTGSRPPLSVVVASTRPWPELRACLDALLDQARTVGAEVIVADRDGAALPGPPAFPEVVRVREDGASVFRLRALGLLRARGEIVAMTEDHCRVRSDWCAAVLAAHRDHPTAAVIGGAVENGAASRLIDWANFLVANGPFLPPVRTGRARRVCGQANLSFKRAALPAGAPTLGVMEMLYTRALSARGAELVVESRLVVEHDQSLGLAGTCAIHFHNGRSIAGFRSRTLGAAGRLARLAGCTVLPAVLFARTLATIARKPAHRTAGLASLPFVVLLVFCHAAGEAIGYVAGPGRSPQRLN